MPDLQRKIGLILGPVAALLILLFLDLQPDNPLVTRAAAVAVLMAIWWITEAIPIPATALLPVALFPLLGVMKGKAVAGMYFNHIIFLFIGGFIMALAMQKWNLHRRIALRIILLIGVGPKRIILGFMAATAFLSMWISNTATTMMMLPIAMAIIAKLKDTLKSKAVAKFSIGLLLGIAYSASIGGTATLIGTPPNLAFSKIFTISFPDAPDITFAGWLTFGLPFTLVFFVIAWLLLTYIFVPRGMTLAADRDVFRSEHARLGKISYEEKVVLILFVLLSLLWLFRQAITIGEFRIPGWSTILPVPEFIDDGTVAMFIAMLLFVIPSRSKGKGRLMDWETAVKLHWGIVILFGGGFALAGGFEESGLSVWLGEQLHVFRELPTIFIVMLVCTMLTFLTELTSNTATTQMVLPILGSLAVAIGVNPLLLMVPATLSASCAFMLPVATPPNAIVFGSGEIRMQDMIRTGIILNLVGVMVITSLMYLVGVHVFDIDFSVFPEWAAGR
jgi:sodium-dependent dicarboxylate transporter 2/3/5